MPRHRGHKNARNTEYAQRAAFDLAHSGGRKYTTKSDTAHDPTSAAANG